MLNRFGVISVVAFYLVGEQEWGRYAHFRAPEGNELQIYQPKPSARI